MDLAYLRAHPEHLPTFLTHQRIRETPVSGGSICAASRLTLDDGNSVFAKSWPERSARPLPDGLFAAALRNIHSSTAGEVRESLNRLKDNVKNRAIPPEDLKDYTIMLSNFGVFAGRYATPIINPPCVCIVAAGKSRHEVVPVLGGVEAHKIIPLSLTFDHRAVTGGEAARFLKAMIEDLQKPE